MYQLVISVETVEMDQSITRRQKCGVVFQKKKEVKKWVQTAMILISDISDRLKQYLSHSG